MVCLTNPAKRQRVQQRLRVGINVKPLPPTGLPIGVRMNIDHFVLKNLPDDDRNKLAVLLLLAEEVHCARRDRRQTERSEEHTSELQSLRHLVCRLLLEKKK